MLRGKNAIITGGRKGIGRACVETFARLGANVWACSHTHSQEFEKEMRTLSIQYNVNIEPIYFDLRNVDEMKSAVQQISKEKRTIDILVNNAGVARYDSFSMMKMDTFVDLLEVNYVAPLRFTQMLSRRMGRKSDAAIVFLSSVAGLQAEIGNTAYGGSKAGLAHATKILSKELACQNIRVNAVAPGMVETDMKKAADLQYWERMVQRTDLKRVASPVEIANAIAFLSSDMASYITGQVIRVDGGMS